MKQILAQITSHGALGKPRWLLSGVAGELLLAGSAGAALTLFVAHLLADGVAVALSLVPFGLGMLAVGVVVHRSYPYAELGLCNVITIVRLALVSALTALLFTASEATAPVMWIAFGVALIALSLDGVDGWAARRAGLVSAFGARFDMEVDAAFALLLSALAFSTGQAGPWVLLLGVPHYLFVAAARIWPWLAGDLPERFGRKAVCVLQIAALVAFLMPIIPPTLLLIAGGIAAAGLLFSFLRDIIYLYAQAAR